MNAKFSLLIAVCAELQTRKLMISTNKRDRSSQLAYIFSVNGIASKPISLPNEHSKMAEEDTHDDVYLHYKKLEKQLEHLDVMEEYIKLETRNLEKELLHAQEEVHSFYCQTAFFKSSPTICFYRLNEFSRCPSLLANFWRLLIRIMRLLAQQPVC